MNKGDLDGAEKAAANIRSGLALGNSESVPVLVVSALEKTGIEQLVQALEEVEIRPSVEMLRWRHRLTSAIFDQVISDSSFDSIVKSLAEGKITLEQAINLIFQR